MPDKKKKHADGLSRRGQKAEEFGPQQVARMMELRDAPSFNMAEALLTDMRIYIRDNQIAPEEQAGLMHLVLNLQKPLSEHFVQALIPNLPANKNELQDRIHQTAIALRTALEAEAGPNDHEMVEMQVGLYTKACERLRIGIIMGVEADRTPDIPGMH